MKLFKNILLILLALFAKTHLIAETINGSQGDLGAQLVYAAQYGNTKTVTALIAAGANIDDTTNIFGNTALIEASSHGHVEAAKALIAAGTNVNAANKILGQTALMLTKNPEIIKALIAAGADVNATDCQGDTALMCVLQNVGHIDTIRAIMAAKPNVGIRNKNGKTAVTLAEEYDNPLIVNIINDPQGDLDDQLVYAAQYGNTKTVTALIAAGANINATYRYKNLLYASPGEWAGNRQGDTALMLAAKFGKTDIVKILIAAGANVNAANGQGETALMKAVEFLSRPEQFSNTLTVKALLAAGANINATNKYGETALKLATEKDRDGIVNAINDHLNSFSSKSLR